VTLTRARQFEGGRDCGDRHARSSRRWAATYRWRDDGARTSIGALATADSRSSRSGTAAFWPATLYFRDRGIVVITSENFDGEWIARIIRRFGYGTARGSTSRGGARALAQLRRDLAAGAGGGFTVDGPRGPARSHSRARVAGERDGHPIVPFHIEAASFWTAKSWDQHQVRGRAARSAIAIGSPMDVGLRPSDDRRIEQARASLEQTLERLEGEARAMIAGH
jgi:lysophospholipid acyltransferase (LPLAT)-like uncharacterized protein